MPADLAAITRDAKQRYADLLAAGQAPAHWWTTLLLTASSARQALRYEEELTRRRQSGQLPPGLRTLVVPDLNDQRLGSGGATINALHELAAGSGFDGERVLLVHAGGDSRRLPQYSLSGKLFSALPVATAWGQPSTLFDELLALSTPWTDRLAAGLVVLSGDVLLTFAAAAVDWTASGVSGVAMRQPFDIAAKHGVYVLDAAGRVYSFLQKPPLDEARAAGAVLADGQLAVDTGLLVFSPDLAARLARLALPLRALTGPPPVIDLYEHVTFSLTGQFHPTPADHPLLHDLAATLHGVSFRCDLVDGEFTHIGTTRLFRHLMAEETAFSRLYESAPRPAANPPGVHSAGIILDSVLAGGGDLASGAVVLECLLTVPLYAGAGAILHGLTDLPEPVEVPPDTVLHQIPIRCEALRGTVLRVYGVEDDPKQAASCATWLGRPLLGVLADLGLAADLVWPGIPGPERTLWNARLFPVTDPRTAGTCARWQLSLADCFSAAQWAALPRLSLADSALWADSQALAENRARRLEAHWEASTVALADEEADLRPLLANAPALVPVAAAGRTLLRRAEHLLPATPTTAASRLLQASLLLAHAGLADEAAAARTSAFAAVRRAVDAARYPDPFAALSRRWAADHVSVAAPARVDLGGGWSDTPPFCLDWGGTVLNLALLVDGDYPVRTTIRRLSQPVIRCLSADCAQFVEYATSAAVLTPPEPGSFSAIPRAALALTGLVRPGDDLAALLTAAGGGLEITTSVTLPLGSGLGTSSILAATVLAALARSLGLHLSPAAVAEQVLRLEQFMTTGGGWQDQLGAIHPGAKLLHSGPGLTQRVRVNPLTWSSERRQQFSDRFVLYDTGLQRLARGLLEQVVSRYLARESGTVQILHSIKTLAWEMAHALTEGDWPYLGQLLSRHHHLNQQLVAATSNAPLEALLESVQPYVTGAKLAGAGGGGFLLLLTADPDQTRRLCDHLSSLPGPGRIRNWTLSDTGLLTDQERGGPALQTSPTVL